MIARIKGVAVPREFSIGGKYLTDRDLTPCWLRTAGSRSQRDPEPGRVEVPAFMRGPEFSRAPAPADTRRSGRDYWFGRQQGGGRR